MFSFMGLINGNKDIQTNVSCTCNCNRSTFYQSMAITQLEFVQILVIVVVLMMMVVVITCLLNHYRLSTQSLLLRHGQTRRHHLPLSLDGIMWSSDGPGSSSETCSPRPDRIPPYMQRKPFAQFQPTYPYLSHTIIDLPPNIPLSDGEEPPPYQGPCTLQLRDPEQQLELNRESVRAPPNRTIFDSPLIDTSLCPPCVNASISTATLECAPPAYSEIIGHYFHPSSIAYHTQIQLGSGVGSPLPLIQGDLQPVFSQITTENQCNLKHKAQFLSAQPT